jgi:hypothetical protein
VNWWIPVLVVVGLLWAAGTYVWMKGKRYRAVFHVDHVRELILGLSPLGQAGLEKIGEEFVADDPRMLITSQGLVLSYAVERRNEIFVHTLMLKHVGGPTTFPVARRFLALALLVFDPDGDADRILSTPERLFYAEWIVGQERQAELNEHGYALPPGRDNVEIRGLIAAADARAANLLQGQVAIDVDERSSSS